VCPLGCISSAYIVKEITNQWAEIKQNKIIIKSSRKSLRFG